MHEHLSRELFRAVATGWRNPGDLAGIALAHLFELCPDCRSGFESWRKELEDSSGVAESADYDAVIDRIRARVETAPHQREAPVRSEIRQARSRAEQLLRLDPAQQGEWVRTESRRYAGAVLAEVLIEEGFRRVPTYPRQCFALASLARVVLHHRPSSLRGSALYARALAHMGNAARIFADLQRAEQLLADARYFLRVQGGGDRMLRAELDRLEASLRMDQDLPEEAMRLLLRALMASRLEGADQDAAATLIKMAMVSSGLHDLPRAHRLLTEAESRLEAQPEPGLQVIILHNRAIYLCRGGQIEAALEALNRSVEALGPRADPIGDLRRLWLLGEIASRLADLDLAEKRLDSVRSGFIHHDMPHDRANVSMDLAAVYLEQGRGNEAEGLAEDVLPVFRRLGLPRRIAAAQELLVRATAM